MRVHICLHHTCIKWTFALGPVRRIGSQLEDFPVEHACFKRIRDPFYLTMHESGTLLAFATFILFLRVLPISRHPYHRSHNDSRHSSCLPINRHYHSFHPTLHPWPSDRPVFQLLWILANRTPIALSSQSLFVSWDAPSGRGIVTYNVSWNTSSSYVLYSRKHWSIGQGTCSQ